MTPGHLLTGLSEHGHFHVQILARTGNVMILATGWVSGRRLKICLWLLTSSLVISVGLGRGQLDEQKRKGTRRPIHPWLLSPAELFAHLLYCCQDNQGRVKLEQSSGFFTTSHCSLSDKGLNELFLPFVYISLNRSWQRDYDEELKTRVKTKTDWVQYI